LMQLPTKYGNETVGRPGSRLLLCPSVAGLGGAYRGGRPPTACYRTNTWTGIITVTWRILPTLCVNNILRQS